MPSVRDIFPLGKPEVAYLFPELSPSGFTLSSVGALARDSTFVFQFWPTQVQDNYEVEYASKMIPGGSHPLYQWIGGSGRTIAFEATFCAEIETSPNSSINTLASLTPSSRYSVNVAAAIARLKAFQYPTYRDGSKKGIAQPPSKLHLVLPNTNIGGDSDDILCFLKGCRVTIESCYPSGSIRVATVALEFIETVQHSATLAGSPSVKFISASSFQGVGKNYNYGMSP